MNFLVNVEIIDSCDKKAIDIDGFEAVFVFKYGALANTKCEKMSKVLVIIHLSNDYNYMKKVVKRLRKLFEKSDMNITYYLIVNDSKYLKDLLVCINAINIKDREKRYAFIYDKTCDYLDEQFSICNYCEFKDDKCIANRNRSTPYKDMGCCYSFDIAGFFSPTLVKNIKQCQYLVNKRCSVKNISCKLHCCKELRKKGVNFNSHKMLALECFFNQKQHDIINLNFFRNREEILNKLMEHNYEPYFIYLMKKGYRVNK